MRSHHRTPCVTEQLRQAARAVSNWQKRCDQSSGAPERSRKPAKYPHYCLPDCCFSLLSSLYPRTHFGLAAGLCSDTTLPHIVQSKAGVLLRIIATAGILSTKRSAEVLRTVPIAAVDSAQPGPSDLCMQARARAIEAQRLADVNQARARALQAEREGRAARLQAENKANPPNPSNLPKPRAAKTTNGHA